MSTRILIIDDEPRWISFVRNNLGTLFEVEVATNLKVALTKLRENHYKLIIAGSRCLDILQIFNKKYPEKRFVVATGQPTTREAIDVYRLGALDYFDALPPSGPDLSTDFVYGNAESIDIMKQAAETSTAGVDAFDGIDVPGAEVPGAEVPGAEVPEAEVPEAEVPEAKAAEAEVPEAKAAEATQPEMPENASRIFDPQPSDNAFHQIR